MWLTIHTVHERLQKVIGSCVASPQILPQGNLYVCFKISPQNKTYSQQWIEAAYTSREIMGYCWNIQECIYIYITYHWNGISTTGNQGPRGSERTDLSLKLQYSYLVVVIKKIHSMLSSIIIFPTDNIVLGTYLWHFKTP